MNKEEEIKNFLEKAIAVGDVVKFSGEGNGSRNQNWIGSGVVDEIIDATNIIIKNKMGFKYQKNINEITRSIDDIGVNPFMKRVRYDSHKIDIGQLVSRLGYDKNGQIKKEPYFDGKSETCTMDPVVNYLGKKFHYQRGLVWRLKDKQSLINSIYLGKDIGIFTFKEHSYESLSEKYKKDNQAKLYFSDLVDGKQRASTILEFIRGEFKDSNGNHFSDLSLTAQRVFFSYSNLVHRKMPESTTDVELLDFFSIINETGTPVSKTHIKIVNRVKNELKDGEV